MKFRGGLEVHARNFTLRSFLVHADIGDLLNSFKGLILIPGDCADFFLRNPLSGFSKRLVMPLQDLRYLRETNYESKFQEPNPKFQINYNAQATM